jgi:hypothetical protein
LRKLMASIDIGDVSLTKSAFRRRQLAQGQTRAANLPNTLDQPFRAVRTGRHRRADQQPPPDEAT